MHVRSAPARLRRVHARHARCPETPLQKPARRTRRGSTRSGIERASSQEPQLLIKRITSLHAKVYRRALTRELDNPCTRAIIRADMVSHVHQAERVPREEFSVVPMLMLPLLAIVVFAGTD